LPTALQVQKFVIYPLDTKLKKNKQTGKGMERMVGMWNEKL
jgi:hypothetical protein